MITSSGAILPLQVHASRVTALPMRTASHRSVVWMVLLVGLFQHIRNAASLTKISVPFPSEIFLVVCRTSQIINITDACLISLLPRALRGDMDYFDLIPLIMNY